ncbi:gcd10p family domain-containing protein [Ditylenchus destructor]|uniref:tRNA (adenine(58)-N(1))-methyltransferase non-catalytic subunit TRM6 n=1 Tax=Ditylenchus destructor TaxID=166010 RepID=A0AAD4N514_9BILA|nr:gcd10p family domain-containing protein [Ditylenchus destructor]
MIQNNRFVTIQKIGGEQVRVIRINKGQNVVIDKLRFNASGAIGKPFGLFEVSNGQITPINVIPQLVPNVTAQSAVETLPGVVVPSPEELRDEPMDAAAELDTIKAAEVSGEVETPTELTEKIETEVPEGVRQKISYEERTALKAAGLSTKELVSRLVDGNVYFNQRTVFSQQKYKEKKAKRYSDRVLIMQPSIRVLVECYYIRSPDRISNLRIDLLGMLLQMSAIHIGCKVFVYEEVLGALAASVIERIAGEGACVFLHKHDAPQSIPCVNAMEFDEKHMDTFLPIRTSTLWPRITAVKEPSPGSSSKLKEEEEVTDAKENCNTGERRRIRLEREQKALNLLNEDSPGLEGCGKLDSIILALRNANSVEILEKAFKSLRLSGTIAIYSPTQKNVTTAYEWLRKNGAVNLQVSDQFYRTHQVLPNRTHPNMTQLIVGGYILSGIKVKKS